MRKITNKESLKAIAPYLIIALIILFVNTQILLISYTPTPSMEPTLETGKTVVNTRLIGELEREDIVVFEQNDMLMIKRIIGLPGEELEIRDNEVYIDGIKLQCDYIKEKMKTDNIKINIPKNSYFVMGDNRNNSMDSRVFGAITRDKIIAKKL